MPIHRPRSVTNAPSAITFGAIADVSNAVSRDAVPDVSPDDSYLMSRNGQTLVALGPAATKSMKATEMISKEVIRTSSRLECQSGLLQG